ncbi:MAG: ferritin-like domain-containing protein [Chloroflexota bacterium]|nr:ferritin-like domain-containing protein [Chloroflexota bacterium]
MKTYDEKAQNPVVVGIMESLSVRKSRRSLMKGAAMGAAGLATIGIGTLVLPKGAVHASGGGGEKSETSIKEIFSIAATAERLAVTTYTHGIANAHKLGISGDHLTYLKAALVEEQIHELFFEANGGVALTSTFSYPHGPQTFESLQLFIETQQQLEGVFDSAFLAAIKEFAYMGQPILAQIAGEIACIESEHRALGRVIGKLDPADNWAFAPVFVESVSDGPGALAAAGYLTPKGHNSFTYQQVSTDFPGIMFRKPHMVGEDND